MSAPGELAGVLRSGAELERAGLSGFSAIRAGTPVSASAIDAHAGVPGCGVGDVGTMVMVLGTSGCFMVNSKHQRRVPGICGVVKGGILPGLYGYETGMSALGDTFEWARALTGETFASLDAAALREPKGSGGLACFPFFFILALQMCRVRCFRTGARLGGRCHLSYLLPQVLSL